MKQERKPFHAKEILMTKLPIPALPVKRDKMQKIEGFKLLKYLRVWISKATPISFQCSGISAVSLFPNRWRNEVQLCGHPPLPSSLLCWELFGTVKPEVASVNAVFSVQIEI